MRISALSLGAVTTAVLAWGGCDNPVYLAETRPLDAQQPMMMMGDDGPALFTDADLFVLPVRKPTAAEKQALKDEQTKLGLMMPVPWAGERDFQIEIEWVIKNLDTQPITARVSLNGGNEFGDYIQSLYVDVDANPEDAVTPPNLLGNTDLVPVAKDGVLSGVFREDELQEAGIDLEVITRYPPPMAGMNAPFIAIEHNSTASNVGFQSIPTGDIIPAMVRYMITLDSTGLAALDYTVRVREIGTPSNKLAKQGTKNLYVSTAEQVMPPVLPTANPTDGD